MTGVRPATGTGSMHGDVIEVLRWALASARLQKRVRRAGEAAAAAVRTRVTGHDPRSRLVLEA